MAKEEKTTESETEKKLSEAEKYRLLNVHSNDRILEVEKKYNKLLSENLKLREENIALRKQIHEIDTKDFYKKLGISRGDNITLHDDGGLTIVPSTRQELFSKKPNGRKPRSGGAKTASGE